MALPSSESTYGSPPYHETAFKAALRLLASNIGPALQGLGAVRPGSNFGEAFLASAGASSRAVSAAHQAAQAYAMKQQEMELRQQEAADKAQAREAAAKAWEKPPKPVETHAKAPWYVRPEWINTPEGRAAQAKANHIATGKGGAAATPKPPKPRGVKEQRIIDAIGLADPNNPAHRDKLNQWLDTQTDPVVRQAILQKLLGNMRVRTP